MFGTGKMKDILCEQTITWAQGTTSQLFGNWVCDMIQINVPTDIQNFVAGVVGPNEEITRTVQMLMSDTWRHILSEQARAVVVSLGAQDQRSQKGGVYPTRLSSVRRSIIQTKIQTTKI